MACPILACAHRRRSRFGITIVRNRNIGGERMRPVFWLAVVGLCLCVPALTGEEYGTGWWRWQPVTYRLVHGVAIIQSDVQLGAPEELAVPWAGTIEATDISKG